MSIEQIVYIARKLGWTLPEIGNLTPKQFNAIIQELYFQESVEEYRKQYSTASLLAAIYNTIPQKSGHKPLQAKDFLDGDMPTRDGKQPSPVDELAKKKGIKLPSK
jgi:hypothetical protein